MSFLFRDVIFGPVRSRRFGVSLGINVLPENSKICTFNCIYCECGWTQGAVSSQESFHSRTDIREALEERLKEMVSNKRLPDALTFAGNGEPTLHPDFSGVIEDVKMLRDRYAPDADVVVLSNSTTLHIPAVFEALKGVRNIMKLDAGSEETYRAINGPLMNLKLTEIVDHLCRFNGRLSIQTLFLRAEHQGKMVDNTTPEEIDLWLGHLKRVQPEMVMIYPIDRPAPDGQISKIEKSVLEGIAARVRALGLKTEVYE